MAIGSTTVARLVALLDADTRSFDRKIRGAETTTKKFGVAAKAALIGGATAGLYALGKAAKIGWDEYNAGQRVAAQTNAVLKSTGGAANVSAQHVEELGRALLLKSGIDDEVIKSGENVLLTFTKIRNEAGKGNDIFDQTTRAALDMSVALGQDLQSSMIQVGKAMNNPTVGLTALRRVGVSFTDQQSEMIQKLYESGKVMEAQKMILAELTKEFGGSAEAAGKTFGGQLNILRERFNNFMGDVVAKGIPYMQRFIKWVGPYAHDALMLLRQGVATVQRGINQFSAVLDRHRETVNTVIKVLGTLWGWYVKLWKVQITVLGVVLRVWARILDVVLTAVEKLVGAIRTLIGVGRTVGQVVAQAFRIMLAPILTVINAVEKLLGLLHAVQGSRSSATEALQGTGRGGSGAPGFNPNLAPRSIGTAPRLAAEGPSFNLFIDGEKLDHVLQRRRDDWRRKGGR